MRGYLRSLTDAGVVARVETAGTGTACYALTPAGRGLLSLTDAVDAWLAKAPHGGIRLGTPEGKNTLNTLVDSWSPGVLRALAARPLSLTELDGVIKSLNYPSLERRLTAMRSLGLVEAAPRTNRNTPYRATDWLRRAVAPLTAATAWERTHRGREAPPATGRDVEAAFMLILPIVSLPADVNGTYRLAVEVKAGRSGGLVGVAGEVRAGTVVSCSTGISGDFDFHASGSLGDWLAAMMGAHISDLEFGGDSAVSRCIVQGLRDVPLF